MTPEETAIGWGRRVVADAAWLLHTTTGVVGRAEEFFDGVERVHVSSADGVPVPGSVLRLSTGHALVCNPNAFVELLPEEVRFHALVVDRLEAFFLGAVQVAAEAGVDRTRMLSIITNALAAQLAVLGASGSP